LLDAESLGDSTSFAPLPDAFFDPAVVLESLGDSVPSGDSEGVLGDPDGVACGDGDELCDDPPEPPLPVEPPPLVGDGLDVGDGPDEPGPFDDPDPPEDPDPPDPDPPDPDPPEPDPEPLVGDDVGEVVGEDVLGDWVGVAAWTGGATPGGTLVPAVRSCCQDHPTEPPAGTVSEPAPDDEYVHDAFEPSAHHRPQ
jgi:hypothetical protein